MKCLVFSAFALMAVLANSCSQFPEDKKVKELILAHERPDFIEYHNSLAVPCSIFKAFKIPKEYEKISILTRHDPRLGNWERDNARANSILDRMALNGLITMTKNSDETFTNRMGQLVNVKQCKIDLTSKGNE